MMVVELAHNGSVSSKKIIGELPDKCSADSTVGKYKLQYHMRAILMKTFYMYPVSCSCLYIIVGPNIFVNVFKQHRCSER